MRLSENVIKHSVGVAEFMADWAEKHYKYQLDPNEMYVLGLLHDIGKLYPNKDSNDKISYKGHAEKGGRLLENLGYCRWREVAHHGHPEKPYWSVQLMVLNMADLSVDRNGNRCLIHTRLESIKYRYGENSDEYQRAVKNVEELIKWKFLASDGTVVDTDE